MSEGDEKTAGSTGLVGNAGEYYVVAELLKRGVIASLTPRNAVAFDILATKGSKTVRIRVKTKSKKYNDWQWVTKKDGSIFRHLSEENDFTVLVNLAMDIREMEYFIVPTVTLNGWLDGDFQKWVSTPGKKGQQRNVNNKKRTLGYSGYISQLNCDWNILWD